MRNASCISFCSGRGATLLAGLFLFVAACCFAPANGSAQPHAGHDAPAADHQQGMPNEHNKADAAAAMPAGHEQHMDGNSTAPAADGTPEADPHAAHKAQQEGNATPPAQDVGRFFTPDTKFEEHLGGVIPEGIIMTNEDGKPVDVRSLLDIPAVIVPVYFTCPAACNVLQSSMAAVIPQVTLTPGKDFRVITVSFDETDTPEMAKRKQHNFLAATDFKFPAEAWTYLTGDKETIKRFMDALGFEYIRLGQGNFAHPVGVVVTAPGGKIARYLYGQGFLPFDLNMAFTEASQGKTGLSIRRVLAYCFSYDPEARGYVFNFLSIVGVLLIFGLAVLLFVLLRGNKKQKKA